MKTLTATFAEKKIEARDKAKAAKLPVWVWLDATGIFFCGSRKPNRGAWNHRAEFIFCSDAGSYESEKPRRGK